MLFYGRLANFLKDVSPFFGGIFETLRFRLCDIQHNETYHNDTGHYSIQLNNK
jgi:hypothetical protein